MYAARDQTNLRQVLQDQPLALGGFGSSCLIG